MDEQETEKSSLASVRAGWRKHPILKVASAYCVGAWLVLQIAEVVLPSYDVPDSVMQLIITVLVALFPVALLAARFPSVLRFFTAEDGAVVEAAPAIVEKQAILPDLSPSVLDIPIEFSERRRITTVVCSLTGMRSGRHDPEVLLGVIPSVEEALGAIVERYDGLRLASSRNEIIVSFGFPALHEDDARRAAIVGRQILDILGEQQTTIVDTVIIGRAGIHTDTIIVDDDGDDEDELALLGDNTAVVEWLRALAPEGGIAVSAESAKLLSGFFALEEIGRESHPSLGQDVPIYSLGAELSGQWQQIMGELSDFFGREHEYQLLLDHWQTALEGESQFVLLAGEAGIGKSSLLYRTVREILLKDAPQLLILNCESYDKNSPFRPVIGYLEQRIFGEDFTIAQHDRLAMLRGFIQGINVNMEETLPIIASLLSLETVESALQMDESSRLVREKTINCIVSVLRGLARTRPILLVVEDLHWADPSTIELLDHLLMHEPDQRIYGLFSSRPDFSSNWGNLSHAFTVHIGKLSDRVSEQLIRQKFGSQEVPGWLVKHLVRESGGIPFFLDELVRGLLEAGTPLLTADPESLQIPPSLQASLDSRVDKLGQGKPLLQLCSVLGQEFPYELLRDVVGADNEQALLRILGGLVSEGFLYQKGVAPDAIFRFKHRLIMEAAYQSLLVKTRGELHGAIAKSMEQSYPDLCLSAPGRLAQHFALSGNVDKAIDYRIMAARRAQKSFANDEALAHIHRGEELLPQLADLHTRCAKEMSLKNLQGMIWLASRGYTNPEVRTAFERAIELSEDMDNSPELFSTIVGMWMYYLIKAEYSQAMEITQRLLGMARETAEAPELLQANYGIGYTAYFGGHLEEAAKFFREAISYDSPGYDYTLQTPSQDDSRVHAYCMLGLALWLKGDPAASRDAVDHAFSIAENDGQPWAKMWAHYQVTFLCHMRRDFKAMSGHAEKMREIALQKGFFFFVPLAEFFQATLIEDSVQRVKVLRENHEAIMSAGARSSTSYYKTIIIEDLIGQGELDAASSLLDDTYEFIHARHEDLFMPEYLRLRALLLSVTTATNQSVKIAEVLTQSIDVSRAMNNRPMALRSALALYDASEHSNESRVILGGILDSYKSEDDTDEFILAARIVATDTTE